MKFANRIEQLRKKVLSTSSSYDGVYLDFLARYEQNRGLSTIEERYADAYTYALERLCPVIDEYELIVGKPKHFIPQNREEEWKRLQALREELSVPGQDSHMAIDYPLLLEKGTSGIAELIDGYIEKTQDEANLRFYKLAKICLQAVNTCAENYAKRAEELALSCQDQTRKAELLRISKICLKVPRYGAESFYEAVQSVSFLTYLLSFQPLVYRTHQYQLGHPDRYLYPYYEKDIASGSLTKVEAQELLNCLAIQINERVPNGLSLGYMVGGRDKNGAPVQNDLTEMCMQVIDDVRLVYPAVGLCMTKDTDEKYLKKGCEILSHGRSHPAIFNDDLIFEGLRLYGVNEQEAREYIHSTCVEITPVACSSIWVASPYTNMPQILLHLLSEKEYADCDCLLEDIFKTLDERIEYNYKNELQARAIRGEKSLCPLLSCFVNDCLKKGKDIEQDGARYRWIMPSFVGIANLVDCLFVLKKQVFENQTYTLQQIREMLENNFEGFEAERLRLLNGTEKYGNGETEVDSLFNLFTQKIVALCKKHSEKYGDADGANRLVPSVFCWIMHERFGRETGATPDGRKAGFPLGDGSGPCQGREKKGPLISILSSTSWSHKEMIGGVAVNMKFSKKTFHSNSLQNIIALVKTYLQRGGFELQINVVDKETLLAAQKDPESYRDLIVRIGGYSDYFVKLSPEMQAEVLLRTEHEV